ncbi:Beta-N-acetylhexosaminidase [Aphelenchoides bicaudatus]|nr:Beta-N-acetylhexosaminidase [Aphelenchoides bicaudatus]
MFRRIMIVLLNPEPVQPVIHNEHKPRHNNPNNLNKVVLQQPNNSPGTYPQFAKNGKFVPSRRIVHLDLKGGAYKMFPYTGQLAKATNGYVYTKEDVRSILQAAKDQELEVIPLVQTLGHLEWVLKLDAFLHLRDDPNSPTVICVGKEGVFELLKDMIDQVATIHKEFGFNSFHMGADEAFQFGFCNGTLERIRTEGNRDRAMLWHLSRIAEHIKTTYSTDVLAWHDMFAHMLEDDLKYYRLTTLIQPVLWSYAEDLDMYLPITTWFALKPFKRVWGASVYKGADGPQQYHSHPMHYIRNHESWIQQFSRVYKDFERIEGLVYSGWSRYDHMAILCELLPVALPQLAFCAETMLEAKPMDRNYPRARQWLGCDANVEKASYVLGCKFPGSKLYELINDYAGRKARALKFIESDYDFNGYLSRVAVNYSISSATTIDKIVPNIDFHLSGLEFVVNEFRKEAAEIYYQETIDEYIFVYFAEPIELLRSRRKAAMELRAKRSFPKRPYIVYPKTEL